MCLCVLANDVNKYTLYGNLELSSIPVNVGIRCLSTVDNLGLASVTGKLHSAAIASRYKRVAITVYCMTLRQHIQLNVV